MAWLNSNAAAVQAVGASVAVLVTIVLAVITWRYVQLTKRLATAAEKQIDFLSHERESRRRQLFTLIKMLRLQLKTLPSDRAGAESMRKATLWENTDLSQLQTLAASLGMKPGQHAAATGTALRRIAELVESVKAVNPLQGMRWEQFDWSGWDEAVSTAQSQLKELWEAAVESRSVHYNPDTVAP